MSELLKLAERCEKATGPDRELDARIWLALFDQPVMVGGGGFGPKAKLLQYKRAREIWNDDWPYWNDAQHVRDVCLYLNVPTYTASLDAAMTLVPEGYAIVNFTIWPGHQSSIELLGTANRKFGREQTIQWVHDRADGRWLSKAATPALTLCAVALHARASAE